MSKKKIISLESLVANRMIENTVKGDTSIQNMYVKALAEECDRLITILRDDELFEKERHAHIK